MTLCIISIILIGLFYIAPTKYSFIFNLIIFFLYIIGCYLYFKNKHFSNYLDFEPIFIIISSIMVFVFPLLVFNNETAFLFSFHKEYSLSVINKGTTISAIALVCFLLGNSSKKHEIQKEQYVTSVSHVNNTLIGITFIFVYLLYFFSGGFEKYEAIYLYQKNVNSFTNYIEPILIALSQVLIYNEIWNKSNNSNYKMNRVYIILVSLIVLQFLFVGARTIASYIVLPLISFYSCRFYKISFLKMILFLSLSVFVMSFLQLYRSGYDTTIKLDWYYKLTDLLIPNTNTYLAIDIVEKKGISFGVTSLSSILLLVPFAQFFFQSLFGLSRDSLNSSDVFTLYIDSPFGMGTNFIAELYLAFGILGVSIFPFLFGYLLSILKRKQFLYYYKSIILYVICGFSVYLVRSGLFYMIRFVMYALLFAWINRSYLEHKKREHVKF